MSEEIMEQGTVPEVEMNPHANVTQNPVVVSVEDLVGSIGDGNLARGGKELADLMSQKVDAALEAEKVAIANQVFNGVEEEESEEISDTEEEEVADEELDVTEEEIEAELDSIFAEDEVEDALGLYSDEEAEADIEDILSDDESEDQD